MLALWGRPTRLCDRIPRREVLRAGGLTALGLSLERLLALKPTAQADEDRRADPPGFARAESCILVYLFGGPSQLDTWDLKPRAPVEFRGEFQPVATNVPGIELCEHFPRLARQCDKLAIVRSMHHEHPRHGYGLYYAFTGQEHARPDLDAAPDPGDFPSVGALVSKLQGPRRGLPPAVTLPRWNRFLDLPNDYAGESAGFLGKTHEPWLVRAEPNSSAFHLGGVELPPGVTLDRLAARQALLARLDRRLADGPRRPELGEQHDGLYEQAFALVGSAEARAAFRLEAEPAEVRERYGASPFGQGLLLARRLVEAGVRLVTVNWHDDGSDVKSPFWDTHKDNFRTLREKLIPPVDVGLSALLDDLAARGRLDSTLVVVLGEFGRTPRIGRVVMNAATDASGRDHWPHAYSLLLAGGGIAGGQVFGATDERAAFVADRPVRPPDLVATILHALGCDLRGRIYDRSGRPHTVCTGRPLFDLWG